MRKRPREALVLPVKLNPDVGPFVFRDDFVDDADDLTFIGLLPFQANVPNLIAQLLADPCPACGSATKRSRNPCGDLDIVCVNACDWLFPVDTGPFPISGRRVD